MVSLSVKFAGIELKNPVIIASSPATESAKNIIKCWEAGAGGIVTKSIAGYKRSGSMQGARRVYINHHGMWAMSTFQRETLTLEAGTRLVANATKKVDIPVIASATALDVNIESWYSTCYALQEAGATMIQLDLFYFPQPICATENLRDLISLLKYLSVNLSIPIIVKLNIEMPVHLMARLLRNLDIAGISYLDSVHVPPPIMVETGGSLAHQFVKKPSICSLFGSWQKPLTLQYTHILSELTRFPLCAGGGLMNSKDAIEVLMIGATLVQFATAILLYGYRKITEIVTGIECFLSKSGYEDIGAIRGIAQQYMGLESETSFMNAKAEVDPTLCTQCGKCLNLVFCDAIVRKEGKIQVIRGRCEGCSLCKYICDAGAIQVLGSNKRFSF